MREPISLRRHGRTQAEPVGRGNSSRHSNHGRGEKKKRECNTANCITSLRVSPGGLQILPKKSRAHREKKLRHARRTHRPASKSRGERIPGHPVCIFECRTVLAFSDAVAYRAPGKFGRAFSFLRYTGRLVSETILTMIIVTKHADAM